MGVCSSDSITKYINFYDIIKEKKAKYQFSVLNTDQKKKKQEHIDGTFLIFRDRTLGM